MARYEVKNNFGTGETVAVFNDKEEALEWSKANEPTGDCYIPQEVEPAAKRYLVRDNLGTGDVVATFDSQGEAIRFCDENSPEDDCYLIDEEEAK